VKNCKSGGIRPCGVDCNRLHLKSGPYKNGQNADLMEDRLLQIARENEIRDTKKTPHGTTVDVRTVSRS